MAILWLKKSRKTRSRQANIVFGRPLTSIRRMLPRQPGGQRKGTDIMTAINTIDSVSTTNDRVEKVAGAT
ncbi:MAG TPA: hypothetical protein PLE35_10145, partial [Lentisphaeria bacterium]|nr:hypothetical protein [Lentisphaeria bacterium]